MLRRSCHCCLGTLGITLLTVSWLTFRASQAAEPPPHEAEFFEKKIRPLLETNCFACHSHKSGKSKGHLVVDSLGALLKGGDSGPALVPGQPEKSLLLKAIGYQDEDLQMPPKGKVGEGPSRPDPRMDQDGGALARLCRRKDRPLRRQN